MGSCAQAMQETKLARETLGHIFFYYVRERHSPLPERAVPSYRERRAGEEYCLFVLTRWTKISCYCNFQRRSLHECVGGQFKGTLLQYLPIVVPTIGILWEIFVFSSSIYIYCNEQLKSCQRRMNNVQIYILVSCNPLISNSKHGTKDARINYIHAATCKPVECSRSKGVRTQFGPHVAPSVL